MVKIKEMVIRIETARKIVQLCSFLIFSAALFELGPWPILLPVLWTMGTPQKAVGDAFAALQWMLYQGIFPWLPLAAFLIISVLLGRALCGWVCPFGFTQELLAHIKRRHKEVSPRTHTSIIYVKYAILATIVFISATLAASLAAGIGGGYASALGVFAPAPFNALSPADTLFAIIPKMLFDLRYAVAEKTFWEIVAGVSSFSPLLWARFVILALVLVLVVYIPQSWCRYLCPHGATMALLNRFSFLGLRRDLVKCAKAECRKCVEACPMMVRILDLPWEKFSDPECIYCLKCTDACPTKAIKPKFP